MRYRFEDLTIDLATESVFRGDIKLDVSGLNFKLLAFMIQQGINVVSFDEIVDGVWSPVQVSNETITQRVRLLRVALNTNSNANVSYIRSVRGKGYQLCALPEQISSHTDTPKLLLRSKAWGMSIGIGLLAFLAMGVIYFLDDETTSAPISTYQKRLERAQFYLDQGEKADIDRALSILALISIEGTNDPNWLIAKSFALSAQVCRFGADPSLAQEAEQLSRQAITLESPASYGYFTLGFSYDCRGHTGQAIAFYRQAIEGAVDPHRVNTSALAYLLGESGALAESLALHKALEENQVNEDFLYLQLGRNYELLQYYRLAQEYYQLSFELYPDNLFSNVALPYYLFKQGHIAQSKKIMEIANQRPHHADLLVLQAEHDLLEGKQKAALTSLESAVALEPNNQFYKTLLNTQQPSQNTGYLEARALDIRSNSALDENAGVALELALIYASLGKDLQANEMLTHAIKVGFLDHLLLQRSLLYKPLQNLPGFSEAVNLLTQHVAKERAKVPTQHLSMAITVY